MDFDFPKNRFRSIQDYKAYNRAIQRREYPLQFVVSRYIQDGEGYKPNPEFETTDFEEVYLLSTPFIATVKQCSK